MPEERTHNDNAKGENEEDAPFADIADQLDDIEWNDKRSDIPDNSFTEVDIETIDRKAIWAELEGTSDKLFQPPNEPEDRVIPKRQFCHRCQYFTEPPEVSCSHDGTEIIEMADMAHFQVRNCPIVLEREQTGKSW